MRGFLDCLAVQGDGEIAVGKRGVPEQGLYGWYGYGSSRHVAVFSRLTVSHTQRRGLPAGLTLSTHVHGLLDGPGVRLQKGVAITRSPLLAIGRAASDPLR